MIKPNITSHLDILVVFDNNNYADPKKGFLDSHLGLSRFATALYMHGYDGDKGFHPC